MKTLELLEKIAEIENWYWLKYIDSTSLNEKFLIQISVVDKGVFSIKHISNCLYNTNEMSYLATSKEQLKENLQYIFNKLKAKKVEAQKSDGKFFQCQDM